MYIIAQTPRFVIRQFTPADEAVYLSLFEDEQVTVHLPKRNQQENRQLYREALKEYVQGNVLGRWGLFNNGDKEFIGICLLRNYPDKAGQVELGYVLARKFWGKGIAFEMSQIMIAYAFTHTNTTEIVAVTTLMNTASQKVLEKTGLVRLDNIVRDNEELAFFSISRNAETA